MSRHPVSPVVERRRRLDYASLLLLCTGLVCGVAAGWLTFARGQHPLLIIPSLLAVYTGARHLTKWEAHEVAPCESDAAEDLTA